MKRKTLAAALLTAALGLTFCGSAMADLAQQPDRLTSVDSRELDGLLIGKTKEQIRAMLGKPSTNYGEYWFYWPSKLEVFDAEEGGYAKGGLMIRFDTRSYDAVIGYEVQ